MFEFKHKHWKHQESSAFACIDAIRQGFDSPCIVSPTGGGKSDIVKIMINKLAFEDGKRILMPFHRRLLLRQFIQDWEKTDVEFGVIARDYPELYNDKAKIQLAMTQTICRNMSSNEDFVLPGADYCFWDELHAQTSPSACSIREKLQVTNCKHIGTTATPVGINAVSDKLIDGGSYSDMLECGAHLPLHVYSPEFPNIRDLTPVDVVQRGFDNVNERIRIKSIIGNVYKWWTKLNPMQLPTICFSPGVKESIWLVEQFMRRGVRTAHIDATRISIVEKTKSGKLELVTYPRDEHNLFRLQMLSVDGSVKIVFNRFVLREGISWNHFYHVISACIFGSLSTYLQSIGRIMRSYHDYDHCIYQDHGGNTLIYGMPDMDRTWRIGDTEAMIARDYRNTLRDADEEENPEPITCPNCSMTRTQGSQCPMCLHMSRGRIRWIRQSNGELVQQEGRWLKKKERKAVDFDRYVNAAIYRTCNSRGAQRLGYVFSLAYKSAKEDGYDFSNGTKNRYFEVYPDRDVRWNQYAKDMFPYAMKKASVRNEWRSFKRKKRK